MQLLAHFGGNAQAHAHARVPIPVGDVCANAVAAVAAVAVRFECDSSAGFWPRCDISTRAHLRTLTRSQREQYNGCVCWICCGVLWPLSGGIINVAETTSYNSHVYPWGDDMCTDATQLDVDLATGVD